jgi:hypothetical protein
MRRFAKGRTPISFFLHLHMEQAELHHGPESPLDAAFLVVQAVLAREEDLLREVDKILNSAPDRIAAERLILDRYSVPIQEAMDASRAALDAWLKKLRG